MILISICRKADSFSFFRAQSVIIVAMRPNWDNSTRTAFQEVWYM